MMMTQPIAFIPGNSLIINSEHLVLRPLTRADATPTYLSWWRDAEVQKGLNMPPRYLSQGEAEAHISRFDNRSSFHLGIFPHSIGTAIGFFTIQAHHATRVATTQIVIGEKNWWGQGMARTAWRACLPFLFENLNMHKAKSQIHGENPASVRLHEIMGYRLEGILREDLPRVGGGRSHVYVYGLLKGEWQQAASPPVAGRTTEGL